MNGTIPNPRVIAFPGGRSDVEAHDTGVPWESVNQMVSSVAHGVKNPLGVLLMGTEYLEKKAPRGDPSAARVAADMRNAITRADAIVRALLDLSAAESPDRREEDLAAVVEASLVKLEGELHAKQIVVARQFAPDLLPLPIDRKQWQQAITHLLANAVTASPPRGTLTIQAFPGSDASSGGPMIHLVIKDEGSGLAPLVLKRAFEPFFTTNQGGSHAGLGLTVARRIILAHGGRIAITNRESGGTQVSVTLAAGCADARQRNHFSESNLAIAETPGARCHQPRAALPN